MKKLLILLSIVFLTSCSKDPIIYNLTTSADPPDGGTVSPITNQYEEGKIASINATPASEYVLESWTGATGYSNSVNIVMDSDKFVIAKFVKKKYVCHPYHHYQYIWLIQIQFSEFHPILI